MSKNNKKPAAKKSPTNEKEHIIQGIEEVQARKEERAKNNAAIAEALKQVDMKKLKKDAKEALERTKKAEDEQKAKWVEPAKEKEPSKRLVLDTTRENLLHQAKQAGLTVTETSGVFRITTDKSKLSISVSKKGASVHLLGFNVDGAKQVTEEQAKARHIGRVRGEFDMNEKLGVVTSIFAKALAAMQVAAVLALFVR